MLWWGSSEKLSRCYLWDQLLVGGECDAPYRTIQWYQDLNDSLVPNSSSSAQYTCWLNISWDWKKIYCWYTAPIAPYEITLNNWALSWSTIVQQTSFHPWWWWWPCEVVWNKNWTRFYLSQNWSWSRTRWYACQTQRSMTWWQQIQTISQTICSRWRYMDTKNWKYVISMWAWFETDQKLATYELWTVRDVSSWFTRKSYNNIWSTNQADWWIFFNADWKHMYLWTAESTIYVAHYKLSTPRDVSTCTLVEKYSWSDFWLNDSKWWWVVFYWTNMYLWNNKTLKRYKVTYNW